MSNREKRWDVDLPFGEVGEKMVEALLRATKVRVEVKRDEMVSETGNVAIEFECNGKPSGIAATESDWYGIQLAGEQYNDEVIIFIKTDRLKKKARKYFGTNVKQGGDGGRAKMVCLPVIALIA